MATAKKPPLFVVGTYQIGKEKVVRAIADALGSKIYADAAKRRILVQLQDDDLNRLITDDPAKACVHITSMADVRISALKKYQAKYSQQYVFFVFLFLLLLFTLLNEPNAIKIDGPTSSGSVQRDGRTLSTRHRCPICGPPCQARSNYLASLTLSTAATTRCALSFPRSSRPRSSPL